MLRVADDMVTSVVDVARAGVRVAAVVVAAPIAPHPQLLAVARAHTDD
jgi:hypothetical protein